MNKPLLLLILAFGTLCTSAQTEHGQSVITADVGYSLVGSFIKNTIDLGGSGSDITTNITPVIMVGFDHGLSEEFSIGIQGSFQSISSEFEYSYTNNNSVQITENVEATINRINVALRPNFHYGSTEELDLYSGVRFGLQTFQTSANSTDPDFKSLNGFDASRLSFGLTVLGARYFFTENIGMNMELSIGVPYAVIVGINARF